MPEGSRSKRVKGLGEMGQSIAGPPRSDGSFRSGISRLLLAALDILFPPRCLICEGDFPDSMIHAQALPPYHRPFWRELVEERAFCPKCFREIPFIREPMCLQCGSPLPHNLNPESSCGQCLVTPPLYASAQSLGLYEGSLHQAINRLKYNNQRTLANPLGHLLSIATDDRIRSKRIDVILPIPLHPKRLKERGYNQSILIAKILALYIGIPVEFGCLERIRWTVPQVELKGRLREKNVRGAFRVTHPERINGKRVLLVDDVLTTGATVNEATRTLMKSGINEVHVLTLGRVVRF